MRISSCITRNSKDFSVFISEIKNKAKYLSMTSYYDMKYRNKIEKYIKLLEIKTAMYEMTNIQSIR